MTNAARSPTSVIAVDSSTSCALRRTSALEESHRRPTAARNGSARRALRQRETHNERTFLVRR